MKFSYSTVRESVLREDLWDGLIDDGFEEDDEVMNEEDDQEFHAHAIAASGMHSNMMEAKHNCENAISEYIIEMRYYGYKALTELLAIRSNLVPLGVSDKYLISVEYLCVAEKAFKMIEPMYAILSDETIQENTECLRKISELSSQIDEEEKFRRKGLAAV